VAAGCRGLAAAVFLPVFQESANGAAGITYYLS
jgi:hypothetical protein